MRLVFVVDGLPHARAGTERQLSILLAQLASRATVDVVVLRPSPWLFENCARLGIGAHFVRFGGLFSATGWLGLIRLWRCLRRLKPDVVHTFLPVANIFGVLAAKLCGVTTIVASRRDFGEWMTPWYLRATRFANRSVDHIVTNAPRVRQLTHDAEGFPLDRVSVIYNGMDVDAFRSLARDESLLRALPVPAGARVAILVANFRPMKRHETAVRAARVLKDSGEDLHIVFIGANAMPYDLREQTRELAKSLEVTDRVHFIADTNNVSGWLALADIGINCSEGEGLSNAVMEYMAAGIPAIVAASGGNPDLIEHGKTGLLFPLDDAPALGEGLRRLANDQALGRELAAAALEHARAHFDVQGMTDHFFQLYVRLTSGARARAVPCRADPVAGSAAVTVIVEQLSDCLAPALAMRNANRQSLRDESYLRWRYLSRPAEPAFVVWLREGAENLAAATVAPHEVLLRGRKLSIGIVGDISVAAAARGRGLAGELMRAVLTGTRHLDGVLVMPNPPLHSTLRANGWREVAGLARYARFTRAADPSASLARGASRRLVGNVSRLLAFPAALRRAPVLDEYRLDTRPELATDYAPFWERIAAQVPLAISRSSEYLQWRYLRHPLHRYAYHELRRGPALAGYAFTRQEGGDLWVDDWLVAEPQAGDALGALLFAWAANQPGVLSVQSRTAHTRSPSIPWQRLGYLRRRDVQAVFIGGKWNVDGVTDPEDWCLTPGDKDV
jgi:L-malate glycosyltransferase